MSNIFNILIVNIYNMKDDVLKELIRKRLIEEIDASGLSYAEIAKQIGVNRTNISQYKNTKKLSSVETLARICGVIGADSNYILGLTNN